MTTDQTTLQAPAKLTLWLRITGVRPDGYHLIDAEMVSLELADVIHVDPQRAGLVATGPFAAEVPLDASNLMVRALALAGTTPPPGISIVKHIPAGGGLGGGSTDAAAVLRWTRFGTSPAELHAAAHLGADIAFCLVGGRARVGGFGEVVEPLAPFAAERELTLVIPPLRVSTPAAYRAWDELVAEGGGSPPPSGHGPNDLEPAAVRVEPRLAWWRDTIAERAGTPPVLAGSGATWFVEGRRDNALAGLVDEGATILVTRTASGRVEAG